MIRLLPIAAALLAGAVHADPSVPTPSNVAAVVTDDGVLVSWDAVDVALSYDLYRADTGELITSVFDTSAVDTTEMVAGYFVTACDAFAVCSDPSLSAPVEGALIGDPIGDPGDDPLVPQNVVYTLSASGGALIEFDPVAGATGYLLHDSRTAPAAFLAYTNVAAEFVIDVFDPAARYRVSAFIEGGAVPYPPMSAVAVLADAGNGDALAEALATIAQLQTDIQALTLDLADALEALAVANARIAELEAMIDGMDDMELADALADLATAEGLLAEQEGIITDLLADNLALEQRAAADLATIAELNIVIETLEAELAAALAVGDVPADDDLPPPPPSD